MTWTKTLYQRSSHPDNFTPNDAFLAAIQRNKNAEKHELKNCVRNACQVGLQFCAVVCFQMSYNLLSDRWISSNQLLATLLVITPFIYLAHPRRSLHNRTFLDYVNHVLIFASFGLGLSPVLYKLTDTISTDTIHTMATMALFLHLFSHKYHPKAAAYASNSLSMNAGFFAAVCLASRLSSSWDAFALLAMSILAFVLFPLLRSDISVNWVISTTFLAGLVTTLFTASYSLIFSASILLTFTFLVLGAPMLFVKWQDHKDTIHGPWDEAIPKI